MAIGKSAIIMFSLMIAAVALVSIFSIASSDRSTDSYYTDSTNHTVNATIGVTSKITNAGSNIVLSLMLVAAIVFLASVLYMFKRNRK
jgi:hypothetical protein